MNRFITLENFKNHQIGKKAERLFVMKEKGINVPSLFCVNEIPTEEKLLSLLDERKEFSVRSSAFCEDSTQLSFAGQFDSILFVKKEDVLCKIKECFASAKNESVISYCKENGINADEIKMTVIIQEMIYADFSGVIFSANPQGILNESVIVIGCKTGDNVVEEKTDVTTCYYNRTDKKYYTEKAGEASPDMTDELIERLIELCAEIEEIFGKLVDIEFAVKNNEVFILQARPITTIDDTSPLILDNSNIVESYPGISLPLTISFVREAYSGVFKGLAKRVLHDEAFVNQFNDTYYNMTGSANGRVYYKISNWYTLLSFLPMSKKIIPIWQDMMGVAEKSHEGCYVKLPFYKRASTYLNVITEAFSTRKNMEKLNASFPATEKYFRENFTDDISLKDIKKLYNEISDKVLAVWDITLLNDLYAFIFTGLLKSEIKKSGIEDYEKKANEFISGISNIESMKPIRAMIRLASCDRKMLDELSSSKSENELEEKLAKYPQFKEKLYEYISLYGDRSPEELKMETITFRESPLLLIKKISELSSDEAIFERTKSSLLNEAEISAKDIAIGIKKRKKRILYFVKKASIGIMNREISRLNRTRIYGMVRSMFLRAGEIFYENNRICDKRDVFYLTRDEIFNGNPDDFAEIIARRKEDYKGFGELPAFSRIVFSDKEFDKKITHTDNISKAFSDTNVLYGTPSSAGIVKGEAVVVKDACNPPDTKGKIIVAKMTDPGWVFILSNSKGIISEKGSLLSHTAIISRELKIPAVVGVKNVSELIKDGDIIELNGNNGSITICDKEQKNVSRKKSYC
ncbi:MAG: PEP/pyruvate-binding domain-containing protein [Acutalibacteraceae bacterium]|nr:PEP/pyruvate-binding domain-containing protein [Acutalibacteraceae bacterium]